VRICTAEEVRFWASRLKARKPAMAIQRMREISKGRTVYASDGAKLGTVRDVALDAFEVESPSQPGYWLPMSCLASAGDGGLRLGVARGSIDALRLDRREDATG
jgi:hypothetical protein